MKNTFTTFVVLLLFVVVTFAQESKPVVSSKANTINKVESTNATTYDFTTGSDKFYGGANGAAEVEAGVWGMIAGDGNASGIVSNADVDPINNNLNNSGYYDGDTNMSGIVSNADIDFVNNNINKSSQVP